jgi:ACS family glucarate transporter-like MFS transporter
MDAMTQTAEAGRRSRVRWLMIALTLGVASVSYLDRANISIAAVYLRQDLGLSDVQLGMVFSAFVLGYAFTQPLAGRLADRFGAYKMTAVGILWWSALTAMTAMIPSAFAGAFVLLLAVRFILGVGEAVIFPASNRLVANWMPAQERGLANGLIFAGVGLGAGVAPPLITTIMLTHGWRWAFWISAAIGLVAFVVWTLLARDRPEKHPRVNAEELAHITAGRPADHAVGAAEPLAWRTILASRHVGLLTLSYFCFGYVAYIFFSWFFIYLSKVRGLDLKSSGLYGTLPFIAMAIASPLGGWVSDKLAIRYGQRLGRCVLAALGMALSAVFVALATQVADARLAAVVLAGGSGALYLAQSAYWTLSADLGKSSAASVAGVMNMGCQIGGAVVASLTPVIAGRFGWSSSLLFAAGVSMVGAVAWLFIDPAATLAQLPLHARRAAVA